MRDVPALEDPIKAAAALAERARQLDSAGTVMRSRFVKTEQGLEAFTGDTAALEAKATTRVEVWRVAANPVLLEVQPIDPGGDAAVTFRYYFDDRGAIRLIDVRGSTFHSGCTNVLRIHRQLTFGTNGDSVAGQQTLTDRADQPVTSASCELPDAMVPPRYLTYADAVRAGVAPAR